MFVIYESADEILVTTLEREHLCLGEWFCTATKRNLDDFERTESNDSAIHITSSLELR